MILFYYIYNNCKNIHSKINNGKSNRNTVIVVKRVFSLARCNCNTYTTNTCGIFVMGSFFAYYIGGPLKSVSSLTIGGPLSSVFSHTIWGPPQINFFAYYMGAPWINFFAYYMGAP